MCYSIENGFFLAKYEGGCRSATEKYPAKLYSNKEASLEACYDQCAKTSYCKYFEYDGTWCHLQRNIVTGGNRYPGVKCYEAGCFMDGNYNAGDIDRAKKNDATACQKHCQGHPRCQYWTFVNSGDNWCYRHTAAAPSRLGTCGKSCTRGPKYC